MKQRGKDDLLPLGFKAAAVSSGIKKNKKNDLGLIYSIVPAQTIVLFTQNCLQGVHIIIDRQKLKQNLAQAIIVNSGNANCATGAAGILAAERVMAKIARELDISKDLVLIASTGVIGKKFPEHKICLKCRTLAERLDYNVRSLAEALMTTDTFSKVSSLELNLGGEKVKITGIAKGAGMIFPNMRESKVAHATMLCFLMTDANVALQTLKQVLTYAVNRSFNLINVDGDMSPNDSVFFLANGLSANRKILTRARDFNKFKYAVTSVCVELAKMIVCDAEGATKFVEIIVKGTRSETEAKTIANAISRSLLVKTMFYGADPNWGRVISAAGASGVKFYPEKCTLSINNHMAFSYGQAAKGIEKIRITMKKNREQKIVLDLHCGRSAACVWTADLSTEYVKINSSYT
ncbi:MAG: bifunctional glutamate N-acetyltransferase/amino-acid acetyltransferase ArgJ [Candidatus Omnitrophota bacterium]